MTRQQVRDLIHRTGIVPAIRTETAPDALFAAEAVFRAGIPVVEITMTVPGAPDVLRELRVRRPDRVIGAGTVLDGETARECLKIGVGFLTGPGLEMPVVEAAAEADVIMIPGALSPTEVMAAMKAGSDFIKVFPCAQVGGPSYIRALKGPFPRAALIASGGVNQSTAMEYLRAGASVLGIRGELMPREAIETRNDEWIHELAGRFLAIVRRSRAATHADISPH